MIRWVNPEKRRFYKASIQKDIFGGLYLLLEWGSLDSRQGNFRSLPCTDIADIRASLRQVFKRRKQKRYQLVKSRSGR